MSKQTLQIAALLGLVVLVLFSVYYPYRFLDGMIPMHFNGPGSWREFGWVEDDVSVPLGWRVSYLLMWMPTVIATQAMLLGAVYLVWRIYRGSYFSTRMVTALQFVGACAALSALFNLVGIALNGWFLTRYNTEFFLPVRIHLDSGETGLLLIGIGVFLLGWVLRLAIFAETENKEYV